jgi:hypothetical protein
MASDSPQALEARIRRSIPAVPVDGIDGSLVASGVIDLSKAGSALGPAFRGRDLPAAFAKTVLWTVSRERRRLTLRLEPLPTQALAR